MMTMTAHAWSMSAMSPSSSFPAVQKKPGSPWARPYEKKQVAICGAGGYLGSMAFGYLQRASDIYGTGLGGYSVPRVLAATSAGTSGINKVLGGSFALAFCGENQMRLTDMTSVDAIAARLKGIHGLVLGTDYYLEKRPVTGGTYEKSVNEKTVEFYLDQPRRVDPDSKIVVRDDDVSFQMFSNTVAACQKADTMQHMFVLETPSTKDPAAYLDVLKTSGIPYTYIRLDGELVTWPQMGHSFRMGVLGKMSVEALSDAQAAAPKPSPSSASSSQSDSYQPIFREDVAAMLCQAMQSLDWTKSRAIQVGCDGPLESLTADDLKKMQMDKQWCVNSETLAVALDKIN